MEALERYGDAVIRRSGARGEARSSWLPAARGIARWGADGRHHSGGPSSAGQFRITKTVGIESSRAVTMRPSGATS